jgi:hypothetical protein
VTPSDSPSKASPPHASTPPSAPLVTPPAPNRLRPHPRGAKAPPSPRLTLCSSHVFSGILDEVALYNRIITAEEIEARGSIFRCAADRNCDGGVDGDDAIAFFERWDSGC